MKTFFVKYSYYRDFIGSQPIESSRQVKSGIVTCVCFPLSEEHQLELVNSQLRVNQFRLTKKHCLQLDDVNLL